MARLDFFNSYTVNKKYVTIWVEYHSLLDCMYNILFTLIIKIYLGIQKYPNLNSSLRDKCAIVISYIFGRQSIVSRSVT